MNSRRRDRKTKSKTPPFAECAQDGAPGRRVSKHARLCATRTVEAVPHQSAARFGESRRATQGSPLRTALAIMRIQLRAQDTQAESLCHVRQQRRGRSTQRPYEGESRAARRSHTACGAGRRPDKADRALQLAKATADSSSPLAKTARDSLGMTNHGRVMPRRAGTGAGT